MKHKMRFYMAASLMAVIVMLLTMIPMTALTAGDEIVYEDTEKGISISVDTSGNPVIPKTVIFKVVVDGETVVSDKEVTGLRATAAKLVIQAAGYSVTFEGDGVTVTPGVNNRYNMSLWNKEVLQSDDPSGHRKDERRH